MWATIAHTSECLVSLKRERLEGTKRLKRTERFWGLDRFWKWWFKGFLQAIVFCWISRWKVFVSRGSCWKLHYLESRSLELLKYVYQAYQTNKFIFWLEKNKFIKQGGMFYL